MICIIKIVLRCFHNENDLYMEEDQKKSVSNIVTSPLAMKTRFQSIGFHYGNGFCKRCSRLTHEDVTSVFGNTQRKSLKLSEATDELFEAVVSPVKKCVAAIHRQCSNIQGRISFS